MWLEPHFLPHISEFVNKYAAKHVAIAAHYAAYTRTYSQAAPVRCDGSMSLFFFRKHLKSGFKSGIAVLVPDF